MRQLSVRCASPEPSRSHVVLPPGRIVACQEPMPQYAPRIPCPIVSCMSRVLLLLYAATVSCCAWHHSIASIKCRYFKTFCVAMAVVLGALIGCQVSRANADADAVPSRCSVSSQ